MWQSVHPPDTLRGCSDPSSGHQPGGQVYADFKGLVFVRRLGLGLDGYLESITNAEPA